MAFPPLILVAMSFLVPQPAKSAATARAVRSADTAALKVWTNDDIALLREMAPISIFRPSATSQMSLAEAPSVAAAASKQPYIKELDPDWYAQQRDTMQARIDADQEQIQEIQQIEQNGDGISGAIPLDKERAGIDSRRYGGNPAKPGRAARSVRLTICKISPGATVFPPLQCVRFFRLPDLIWPAH